MFSKYIIYNYNDLATFLVRALSFFTGDSRLLVHIPPIETVRIDILSKLIILPFFKVFHPITASNILLLAYIVLNTYFSYKLFYSLYDKKNISIVLALFYSLSNYFIYRVTSLTINLYPIFFFPLILHILIHKSWKPIYIGPLLLLFFSYSSYYGYFVSWIILFWFFSEYFVAKRSEINKIFKRQLKDLILIFAPAFIFVSIFFFGIISRNIVPGYEADAGLLDAETPVIRRPIEDFYAFSLRPWYFVIPPKSSIFFEDVSKELYYKIEKTGNYLADDYNNEEVGGTYLGWHIIIAFLISTYLVFSKQYEKTFPALKDNRKLIIRLCIILVCIFLISLPPTVAFREVFFYTPTIILYTIFPFFRNLARFTIVINLISLITVGFLIKDLLNYIKKTSTKNIILGLLIMLHIFIVGIRVPVIDVTDPPEEIKFIEENTTDFKVHYAVYPIGDFHDSFWVLYHKNYLINPKQIRIKDFNTDVFSANLVTIEGLESFKSYNPKYLLFYKNEMTEEKMMQVNSYNKNLKSISDIDNFFERNVGERVFVNSYVNIYEVREGNTTE